MNSLLSLIRSWLALLLFSLLFAVRVLADDPASNAPPAIAANDQIPVPPINADAAATNLEAAFAASNTNVLPDSASATTVASAADDTNAIAPEPGQLPTPGVSGSNPTVSQKIRAFEDKLDQARQERAEHNPALAVGTLQQVIESSAPVDLRRRALFELALANQDQNQLVKAEQVFAEYLHLYPDDPTAPEVILRQGLIYRQMGVTSLAISKFYAVMSTALKLKLDNMDYYKKLVLQAQIEIADTYYLEGRYTESSDYFNRLLKNPPPDLDQSQINYKLIRSLSGLTNSENTVARAQVFLDVFTNSADVPEVRFLLAKSLQKLGRNQDSLKQVLILLQTQSANVQTNPEVWAYWQRKAGTEIASQLYKENDFLDALQIYISLADLDKSPSWQLPVWYQTAQTYEQLEQWQKASDFYQHIVDRCSTLAGPDATPGLISLSGMAKWRKDYLAWLEKAKIANLTCERPATNNPGAPDTH
jgi:tetratricopeptide (TPR) repeat protein